MQVLYDKVNIAIDYLLNVKIGHKCGKCTNVAINIAILKIETYRFNSYSSFVPLEYWFKSVNNVILLWTK